MTAENLAKHDVALQYLKEDVDRHEKRIDKLEENINKINVTMNDINNNIKTILLKIDGMRFSKIMKFWHIISAVTIFSLLWFGNYLVHLDHNDLSHFWVQFFNYFHR